MRSSQIHWHYLTANVTSVGASSHGKSCLLLGKCNVILAILASVKLCAVSLNLLTEGIVLTEVYSLDVRDGQRKEVLRSDLIIVKYFL